MVGRLNKGALQPRPVNSDFKAIGYTLIGIMALGIGWAFYSVYG